MKALVVISDAAKAVLTCGAFAQADFNVQLAESALYALTMLERDKPDVIVSDDALHDMSGADLLEILREDSSMDEIGFLLISDEEQGVNYLRHSDMLIDPASSAQELVQAAERLTKAIAMRTNVPVTARRDRGSVRSLSGTLEVFSLLQLLQSLHQQRRSGQLFVRMAEIQGMIVIKQGQLIHAAYLDMMGEEAVRELVVQTKHKPETNFRFEVFKEPDNESDVVSITKVTDRLLLDLALEKSAYSV